MCVASPGITIEPAESSSPQEGAKGVQEIAEELWDKYSEQIGDSIDDASYFSGREVITELQFKKIIAELFPSPPKN